MHSWEILRSFGSLHAEALSSRCPNCCIILAVCARSWPILGFAVPLSADKRRLFHFRFRGQVVTGTRHLFLLLQTEYVVTCLTRSDPHSSSVRPLLSVVLTDSRCLSDLRLWFARDVGCLTLALAKCRCVICIVAWARLSLLRLLGPNVFLLLSRECAPEA